MSPTQGGLDVKLAVFNGSHNISEQDFCKLYNCLEKKQTRALILNFSKIKSEDEFVLLDEKELFTSFDFYEQSEFRAPSEDPASLIIEDGNTKFN